MNFSFSTNAFVRHSIFEAIEAISDLGYEGVELLADAPHLYALSITDEEITRLKELLSHTGLRVANINANTAMGYYGRPFYEPLFEPSLANPDTSERRWRIEYTKKCIDMANAMNSPCISVTSGRIVPGITPLDASLILKKSLVEVAEYAEDRNIRVGIEYEPGLLVENSKELLVLMDDLGSPFVGVNLDLGHCHVIGEDIEEVISLFSNKIFHVHLEDIKARKHHHLIPGLGDMDIQGILEALQRHSYNNLVTVELYTYPHMPREAAKEALLYLRKYQAGLKL
ncbi:Sugar phosphate isomerase/epimerase [uncultured Desulfobacterium sp.]|uniref:Sugar phosphate isomerase/epimerase n=1 Tax=uncultured Desulfobacterium sp. TaxID=201089 RepID=A0A445N114_9BACT|nr:Sugar phosphate isomerase/epimerase [uncultured Desulfobacterium sp.]